MNPGEWEIEENKLFAGSAGRLLDRTMNNIGVSRSEVYIINVVHCRTPDNREPTEEETECCKPLLEAELAQLHSARIFVLLGEYALTSMTGETGIGGWRGYVEPREGRLYLPTYHPSGVFRSGGFLGPYLEQDLKKSASIARQDSSRDERLYLSPSDSDVGDYTRQCRERGVYALDIETSAKVREADEDIYQYASEEPVQIDLIGISCAPYEAVVLHPEQFYLLEELVGDPAVTCVMFNKLFDAPYVSTHYPVRNKIFDAMIALYFLYPQARPKNLAMAASLFAAVSRWKPTKHWQRPFQSEEAYNARDAYSEFMCYEPMLAALRVYGMEKLFQRHGMELLDIVDEWRRIGVRSDTVAAVPKELLQRMVIDECEQAWNQVFPDVEWSSSKQLTELLYDRLHLPVQYNYKHVGRSLVKSRTADKEALEKLTQLRPDLETLKVVVVLRNAKSDLDFLGRIGPDGRSHPKTFIHRTESGRLAQREPTLYNVPEDARDIYLPDCEDCVWGHVDYSQIEVWLTAWYSKCRALLKIKETGEYIHGIVFEDLFKRPFFEPGKPRLKRYQLPNIDSQELLKAKIFPHGVDYGLGEKGLAERYSWSVEQARAYRNNYLIDKPEIPRFHSWIEMQLHQHGILRNAFGRVRRFSIAERNEALSFLGQSTALDVLISKALLPLHNSLRDFECSCGQHHRARVMFGVHDSAEGSWPRRWVTEIAKLVSESMSSPVSELNGFTLPVEVSVGPNWRDLTVLEI
jgi:uracil-DNA glycosylase family 4